MWTDPIGKHGQVLAEAPALTAAITLGTRSSKTEERTIDGFELWASESGRFLTVDHYVDSMRTYREIDPTWREEITAERVAAIAAQTLSRGTSHSAFRGRI
jgi:hypothetical protein